LTKEEFYILILLIIPVLYLGICPSNLVDEIKIQILNEVILFRMIEPDMLEGAVSAIDVEEPINPTLPKNTAEPNDLKNDEILKNVKEPDKNSNS
jgi:hypothetical protein